MPRKSRNDRDTPAVKAHMNRVLTQLRLAGPKGRTMVELRHDLGLAPSYMTTILSWMSAAKMAMPIKYGNATVWLLHDIGAQVIAERSAERAAAEKLAAKRAADRAAREARKQTQEARLEAWADEWVAQPNARIVSAASAEPINLPKAPASVFNLAVA